MAVSGSKDYAITRADIIEGALRKLGVYDQSEAVPGDEVGAADAALNLLVKEWVARGADLWLRSDVTLFLQPKSKTYALGSAHATESYVDTTLSSAGSSSDTVLSVASTAGMAAGDNIGIKLDTNAIHWDTVTSVDTSTQVTITAGLASAAASGKRVYAYTTRAGRPQKIIYAYRRDTSDIDTEVNIIGEAEYQRQSNKGSSGPPTEVWYRPTLGTGTLHVWPVDGGATFDKLVLVAQYLPDDFDTQANNPEFPIEWGRAIIWGLAAELASEYGLPEKEKAYIERKAEFLLGEALDYDVENASVIFSMDYQR